MPQGGGCEGGIFPSPWEGSLPAEKLDWMEGESQNLKGSSSNQSVKGKIESNLNRVSVPQPCAPQPETLFSHWGGSAVLKLTLKTSPRESIRVRGRNSLKRLDHSSWKCTRKKPGPTRWISHLSHSVVSDSLQPHESQHSRPPCPSPTPGVYSNSCPSSQWCHPAISSSIVPFSSCPQSLPASGWPKYWSFSFTISLSNEHPGLIFRMDWLDLLAQMDKEPLLRGAWGEGLEQHKNSFWVRAPRQQDTIYRSSEGGYNTPLPFLAPEAGTGHLFQARDRCQTSPLLTQTDPATSNSFSRTQVLPCWSREVWIDLATGNYARGPQDLPMLSWEGADSFHD